MSAPFLFTPGTFGPFGQSPYLGPFLNNDPTSPFIPPMEFTAPGMASMGAQPERGVRFLDDDDWANAGFQRPRRRSWQPGMPSSPAAGGMPPLVPASPGYLVPPPALGHHRTRSWGAGTQPPPWYLCAPTMQPVMQPVSSMPVSTPMLYYPNTPLPASQQLHPYLNGEAPRPDFFFDLSAHKFEPSRIRSTGDQQPLTAAELDAPATHPPTYRMRITCDMVPTLNVVLEYARSPRSAGLSLLQVPEPGEVVPDPGMAPITLRDVLLALYYALHKQITHLDWGRLGRSEETAVARAYTRRCRSARLGGVRAEQDAAAEGVKWVDFLLDRYMFKGFVRVSASSGFEELKLVVGTRG